MAKHKNTITVGLDIDSKQALDQLVSNLDIIQTTAGKSLSKGAAAEIAKMKKEIASLSQSMQTMTYSKASAKSMASFHKSVNKQIDDLNQRTTTLEKNMSKLTDILSKEDSLKASKALKEFKNQLSSTKDVVIDTVEAVHLLQETAAKTGSNITFIDKKQKSQLEEELALLKDITDIINEEKDSKINLVNPKNIEQTTNAFNKVVKEIKEIKKQMDSLGTPSSHDGEVKLSALQSEFANKVLDFRKMYSDIYEAELTKKETDQFEKMFADLLMTYDDELEKFQKRINSRKEQIKSLLTIDESSIQPKSGKTGKSEKNGLTVPLSISTNNSTIYKQALDLVVAVQKRLNSNSNAKLQIDFALKSSYSSKTTNKLLQEFKSKINTVSDETLKSDMNDLYDKIATDFNKAIKLNITSDIEDEKRKVLNAIEAIKKQLTDAIHIFPEIELNKDQLANMQTLLDEASKTLTLKVDKVKLSDEAVKKAVEGDGTTKKGKGGKKKTVTKEEIVDLKTINDQLTNILKSLQLITGEAKEATNPVQKITDLFGELSKTLSNLVDPSALKLNLDTDKNKGVGKDFGLGYAEGIRESIDDVKKAATEMVDSALEAVRQAQDSHSPSKKTAKEGDNFVNGYVNQINDGADDALKAGKKLADAAVGGLKDNDFQQIENTSKGANQNNDLSDKTSDSTSSTISQTNAVKLLSQELEISKEKATELFQTLNTTKKGRGLVAEREDVDKLINSTKELNKYQELARQQGLISIPKGISSDAKAKLLETQNRIIADIKSNALDAAGAVEQLQTALEKAQTTPQSVGGSSISEEEWAALERTMQGIDEPVEEYTADIKQATNNTEEFKSVAKEIPEILDKNNSPLSDNAYKELFRMSKNPKSENQAVSNQLLELNKQFKETGKSDILQQMQKLLEESNLSKRMKGAISKSINLILNDIQTRAKEAVEETAKKTRTVTISKSEYAKYLSDTGAIAFTNFDNNLEKKIKALEKKGLATRKGKNGKDAYQLTVEVDADYVTQAEQKLAKTKQKAEETTISIEEMAQAERNFGDAINVSTVDLEKEAKVAEEIKSDTVDLDKAFKQIQAYTKKFGNFNLAKNTDKEAIEKIVKNFQQYKELGGDKELSDLTNNEKALSKITAEYEKQTKVVRENTTAKKENKKETQTVDASQNKGGIKGIGQNLGNTLVGEALKVVQGKIPELQDAASKAKIAAEESAKATEKESKQFKEVKESASNAATGKKEFVEANQQVLQSIINSLKGLENEGKAFESINKLINNVGGKNGGEKLNKTLEGLVRLRDLLTAPVEETSLISTLQQLASQGGNLENLATVLKATKKQIENAQNIVAEHIADPNQSLKDMMDNNAQSIRNGAISKLIELGGGADNASFVNMSKMAVTKDGFIEIVGLIKLADNTMQEFTLHTKDGLDFMNVGMTENTAAIANQLRAYSRLQQAMERSFKKSQNATETAFIDKDKDPALWKEILSFADAYGIKLENIVKITRQVREEKAGGEKYLSYSFDTQDKHITVGKEGVFVASNQDLVNTDTLIQRMNELVKKNKDYYQIRQKVVDDTATADEIARVQKLDQEYAELLAQLKDLSGALGSDNLATKKQIEFLEQLTKNYNDYLSKVSMSADSKIERAELTRSNQNNVFSPAFSEDIKIAKKYIEELNDAIANHPQNTPWSDKELARISEMDEHIRKTIAGLNDQSNIMAKTGDVDKLLGKIATDLHDNSAMDGKLKNQFIDLQQRLQALRISADGTADGISQIDKVTFGKLKAEFLALDQQMKTAGKMGKSTFAKIADAIKSQNAQFIAMYFSFQDLLRYARTAFETIRELDTQLVDLRKTTTMNNTELENFYINSNKVAKQMGVTTSEIISQASAWSRLGYSSNEAATQMAQLSSQFTSISPGMDTEGATDALVSTMKAFHVEVENVESEIMDPINRLGNTMATSNQEIAEMLKRSSAAMAAANNSIQDTLALESAAVQITRNAETTGTAFRTKNLLSIYTVMCISNVFNCR